MMKVTEIKVLTIVMTYFRENEHRQHIDCLMSKRDLEQFEDLDLYVMINRLVAELYKRAGGEEFPQDRELIKEDLKEQLDSYIGEYIK